MSTVRIYPMAGDAEAPFQRPAPEPVAPAPVESSSVEHRLRRTGARPFRFHGDELCSATGHASAGWLWHEINLYRTDEGKIVTDLRVFKKAPNEKDSFYGIECDTLEEAVAWLESFDPRQDVAADLPLDDPGISVAELTMHGIALRMRMEEAVRQYKVVLGELLYAMRLS